MDIYNNRLSDNKSNDSNVEFVEKHIGGIDKDNISSFHNQNNIILNSTSDYERLVNYHNKLERDKNKTNEYTDRLDNERHTTVYRVNNVPTTIDDVNFSNPIIYPKGYNQYIEYLEIRNINTINTVIVKNKNYVNIDSTNREIDTSLNVDQYINLPNYSLEFINNNNTFKIYLTNADKYYLPNDNIILRGFKNYTVNYIQFNFFFKNGSTDVVIDLKKNYDIEIPYYDNYIQISNVINGNELLWKNIPLQLINQTHKLYINSEDTDRFIIKLPIPFYCDNDSDSTLVSDCTIQYYSLGNYPINLINANTPITSGNLSNYLIVTSVTNAYLEISLNNFISLNNNILFDGYCINDTFRTGTNIQISKIISYVQGYSNPNNYTINLNKNYNNICSVKIISSEIPNVQKNINSTNTYASNIINTDTNTYSQNLTYLNTNNNKLYWYNILDSGIYNISLDSGYYSFEELKNAIETKVSKVKRNIIVNTNLYDYNEMIVNFNTYSNITQFNMFNTYVLPNCLDSVSTINISQNANSFIIKIRQDNHNVVIGDKIFIINSTDYYTVSANYINIPSGHIVTNVINNNYYEITINNINPIQNAGDTKGGFNIKIKTYAIFRLYFNYSDTFGSNMGFILTGNPTSITNFSGPTNGYTITNILPYYIDTAKVLIANNNATPSDINTNFSKDTSRYILMQIQNLNNNSSPNGPSYFAKFLLNGQPNSYLYNTFVPSPVYINPPLKSINQLSITFIDAKGNLVDFGNLNHSFTLEITSLNNYPENTNLNTNMVRI